MGIVWLASYPKSGNTWVRFLLANYLAGPIESSFRVEALIPGFHHGVDAHRLLAERSVVYGKSHHPWGPRHPFAALTERAVFITRHPKDVLLSNLNYERMCRVNDGSFSDEQFARAFIASGGVTRWLKAGFGTLEEHARSWMNMSGPPCLKIKYENLKHNAAAELSRIVEFLGLTLDDGRIATAVKHSTFERMKALEIRERASRSFSEVWVKTPLDPRKPRLFMSEGRSGSSLAHIHPDLDEAFERRFAGLLELTGYRSSEAA